MNGAQMDWISVTMIVLVGGLGVWLAVYPGTFLKACTLGRILLSDFDLLGARLLGGGLLWAYAIQLPSLVRNPLVLYPLNAVWISAGILGGILFVRDLASALRGTSEAAERTQQPLWEPVEGESPEETRERYKAAWRRYRRLRFEFPLSIPSWFVFTMPLGSLFRWLNWNENILGFFILAWIPVMTVLGWQWMYWRCPRCGNAFKGKYPFFGKRCYYCGLPKWAESPDG